jgi:hypothetical protein
MKTSFRLAAVATAALALVAAPPAHAQGPGGPGGPGGGSTTYSGTYLSVYTLSSGSKSLSGAAATLDSSSTTDTSTIWVSDTGNLTLTGAKITQSTDTSSTDDASRWGLNATVLATSGGVVSIKSGSVSSSGIGGNGLFASGSGSSITMSNGSIATTGTNGAHGVDVTYGGAISLNNVNVSTTGAHSSAIATDFGGGTVVVNRGVITTTGAQSAGIYSTGDITVKNAQVTSYADNGAVIDADGRVTLVDTKLTGQQNGFMLWRTVPDTSLQGYVTASGGSINGVTGDAFLVTGTDAHLSLDSVTLTAGSGVLVDVTNGGTADVTATDMTLAGNLFADATSTLTATLADSSLVGTVTNAALDLEGDSFWSLTGNSFLDTLTYSSLSQIDFNGYTITLDDGTVLGAAAAVPEPGMPAMMLSACCVIGWIARRRAARVMV